MNTVTIYTIPGCASCDATKVWMRRAGVEFEEVDLALSPAALAYVRDELGQREAPVTVRTTASGQVQSWSGLCTDRIRQLATERSSAPTDAQAVHDAAPEARMTAGAIPDPRRPPSLAHDVI